MKRNGKGSLEELIAYVNRKDWWHVPPQDPRAYLKRGKFLAWSYKQAEFYGRPLDQPDKVLIQAPLVGDEPSIERRLFGHLVGKKGWREGRDTILRRLSLDGKMRRVALAKGYDSIVLMSRPGFTAFRASGNIPRSIELNILIPVTYASPAGRRRIRDAAIRVMADRQ